MIVNLILTLLILDLLMKKINKIINKIELWNTEKDYEELYFLMKEQNYTFQEVLKYLKYTTDKCFLENLLDKCKKNKEIKEFFVKKVKEYWESLS